LEHFMTAATMELKLLEHARRQCTAIFDETYLFFIISSDLMIDALQANHG